MKKTSVFPGKNTLCGDFRHHNADNHIDVTSSADKGSGVDSRRNPADKYSLYSGAGPIIGSGYGRNALFSSNRSAAAHFFRVSGLVSGGPPVLVFLLVYEDPQETIALQFLGNQQVAESIFQLSQGFCRSRIVLCGSPSA